jgi:hypothetical protein
MAQALPANAAGGEGDTGADESSGPWIHAPSRKKLTTWEVRFYALVKLKETYGHVNIPRNYPDFGDWPRYMKRQYNLHINGNGKKSKSTQEKIDKLIGIVDKLIGIGFLVAKGSHVMTMIGSNVDFYNPLVSQQANTNNKTAAVFYHPMRQHGASLNIRNQTPSKIDPRKKALTSPMTTPSCRPDEK